MGSRFRDRVYVTWTTFAPDGSAYIYESHSADYAETWSAPVRVSAAEPNLCKVDSDKGTDPDQGGGGGGGAADTPPAPGQCYANQFSQPFTGPDGALYVTWANFNNAVTAGDNRNQILLAKSTDGGATFSTPVKVTDYYDLPDCVTYTGQDPGRACVPAKRDNTSFFRATNYPVGVVDPKNPNHVVVTVGSYINRGSNEANGCVPTGFSSSTVMRPQWRPWRSAPAGPPGYPTSRARRGRRRTAPTPQRWPRSSGAWGPAARPTPTQPPRLTGEVPRKGGGGGRPHKTISENFRSGIGRELTEAFPLRPCGPPPP